MAVRAGRGIVGQIGISFGVGEGVGGKTSSHSDQKRGEYYDYGGAPHIAYRGIKHTRGTAPRRSLATLLPEFISAHGFGKLGGGRLPEGSTIAFQAGAGRFCASSGSRPIGRLVPDA